MAEEDNFISSLSFDNHPMASAKGKTKRQYYYALQYIMKQIKPTEYTKCRLELYKQFLTDNNDISEDEKSSMNAIVICNLKPWRYKYKFFLLCDIALIVNNYWLLETLSILIKNVVSSGQRQLIEQLLAVLKESGADIPPRFLHLQGLIEQFWTNSSFLSQKEKRILVTANMSAGKSTLINALTGKNVARTSQEVCTGNICYFYNKAFDDGRIHFNSKELTYNAQENDIKNFKWDKPVSAALYFKSAVGFQRRICLVDTPGVNSAIKREHGRISKECIKSKEFDVLLYILNANKLGTDEEIAYLKWISKNVPEKQLIFVLNKLDDFRTKDDNIESSIEGVRADLQGVGFENPLIFPISAYFSYLIKKDASGELLSEDEKDDYELYKKKFDKPEYNLSRFYEETVPETGSSFESQLRKSGIYYLEKEIYGGLK